MPENLCIAFVYRQFLNVFRSKQKWKIQKQKNKDYTKYKHMIESEFGRNLELRSEVSRFKR